MSARYLKKVLKEQELKSIDEDSDSSELLSPDSSVSALPNRNPFDLLNDDDDDDGDDNDAQQENGLENSLEETVAKSKETKGRVDGIPSTNRESKKKKNKKNMKDKDSNKVEIAKVIEIVLSCADNKSSCNQAAVRSSKSIISSSTSILQIDPKLLSAESELRRIFGSKVVSSFKDTRHQTSGSSSRQMRGGVKHRGLPNHKKTMLVSSSDLWQRWDGSLSMELVESRNGCHYFRYAHSSSYRQAQRAFEDAKASHDLDSIINVILRYHPYHIDSLITIAEYYQLVGQHQMSSDIIARCLYALECAWHPMFNSMMHGNGSANCKLEFSHDENKPMFTALFIHMKNLDRRGCHRAALEVCKMLLSLDSEDAKGALHCIDYFAIRAEQYNWLERFSQEYHNNNDDNSSSLWMFPNFSYSLAVCRFYIEQSDNDNDNEGKSREASSTSSSSSSSSSELMKQALMLHPLVVKKLVEKVPLKDGFWTSVVLKHEYFKLAEKSSSPSLDHLTNIYAERSYLIWRLPELQKLLKESAKLVIEMLDENKSEARDWDCVRKEAFPSHKNEYGHLLVSDFSDKIATVTPENLNENANNVDPVGLAGEGGEGVVHDDVAERHPLAVLIQTILPWNVYANPRGAGGGGGGEEENQQHNNHNEDD